LFTPHLRTPADPHGHLTSPRWTHLPTFTPSFCWIWTSLSALPAIFILYVHFAYCTFSFASAFFLFLSPSRTPRLPELVLLRTYCTPDAAPDFLHAAFELHIVHAGYGPGHHMHSYGTACRGLRALDLSHSGLSLVHAVRIAVHCSAPFSATHYVVPLHIHLVHILHMPFSSATPLDTVCCLPRNWFTCYFGSHTCTLIDVPLFIFCFSFLLFLHGHCLQDLLFLLGSPVLASMHACHQFILGFFLASHGFPLTRFAVCLTSSFCPLSLFCAIMDTDFHINS